MRFVVRQIAGMYAIRGLEQVGPPAAVEVGPEFFKLRFQIAGIPIEKVIQIFSADRANESFDKGIGNWEVGN